MERTLTYNPDLLERNVIDRDHFVKIVLPTPHGTLRYTNHIAGTQNLDVDGSTETWLYWDFTVGSLDQGEQDILSVSTISIQNVDNTWTNFASDPGIRRRDIQIWRGWYDDGVFDGAVLIYEGRIDGYELGPRAQLSLVPHNSSFPQTAPWAKPGPLCYSPYRDPQTCQFSGVAGSILTNGGSGYGTPPTIGFSGGGGSGVAAFATVSGGQVTAITYTNSGSNYTTMPTMSFSGGGGSGAAATATREPNGELTCPHTRAGCGKRLNTAHFPCDDLAPIEGTIIYR